MDHQVLLQIIKTSLSKYSCWLHAYCLMTNHVHLLIETGDIEIGKFMKYMSECYAIYYNHKYGYRGHVFESRYKSSLVKEDTYFLQTSRYIHLNPVKAQMADYPEDYLWSSYRTMIPEANLKEAGLVHGVEILGFHDLTGVLRCLEGKTSGGEIHVGEKENGPEESGTVLDFKDVKGQDELIEAVVLAAAGGHNMLMVGEPRCGKTMIAQRIPTILPEMTEEECLEVTKIYSISGLLPNGHALMKYRPFRAPHHNASLNALIGGGAYAMPGEVSLAHNGVLFLDELAEFSRRTLDALRQPIEDKKVSISRVNGTHTFPFSFMFITAMNPCPCGYYPGAKCKCTDYEIIKYRGKISGPIMDRIDIQKKVHPVDFFAIADQKSGASSEELRTKVEKARKIQQERYAQEKGINCNAQMTTELIQRYCVLDKDSLTLLRETSEKYGYSARVIHKLLRLARTSADLDGEEKIRQKDIEKVLTCREQDKSNSKMVVVK